MKKEKLEISVFDENGEIIKKCEAKFIDLEFGTIRKMMKLLNIENTDSTTSLLSNIYDAWDELTVVLSQCFPEMETEDWEHVKIKELLPIFIKIIKKSISEIMRGEEEKN